MYEDYARGWDDVIRNIMTNPVVTGCDLVDKGYNYGFIFTTKGSKEPFYVTAYEFKQDEPESFPIINAHVRAMGEEIKEYWRAKRMAKG